MTEVKREEALTRLKNGKAPGRGEVLHAITCGVEDLTAFLTRQYLDSYIPEGGSKIKFLTGRPGSGKTHVLELLEDAAVARGFQVVELSANEVWMHDFKEFYLAVLRRLDLEEILKHCAEEIIREMGYDPNSIAPGQNFVDYLAGRREADPITKSTIRAALRQRFTQNPRMDNCFAACCSLLVGDLLGHPTLDAAGRNLAFSCLTGEKGVKTAQLRALGISPSKVSKYNARHLLRSLAELVHLSGASGLMIAVDDLERLLNGSTENAIRYTRGKRDDAYESIRQLIDDIDSMRHLLFVIAFDRELIDNENIGIKSYQALWMRIQNEVVSVRVNCFADVLDLDRVADQAYSTDVLRQMAAKLTAVLRENGILAEKPEEEEFHQLLETANYGGLGLPYLVNRRVLAAGSVTGGAKRV